MLTTLTTDSDPSLFSDDFRFSRGVKAKLKRPYWGNYALRKEFIRIRTEWKGKLMSIPYGASGKGICPQAAATYATIFAAEAMANEVDIERLQPQTVFRNEQDARDLASLVPTSLPAEGRGTESDKDAPPPSPVEYLNEQATILESVKWVMGEIGKKPAQRSPKPLCPEAAGLLYWAQTGDSALNSFFTAYGAKTLPTSSDIRAKLEILNDAERLIPLTSRFENATEECAEDTTRRFKATQGGADHGPA